jgi:hypothetical protein
VYSAAEIECFKFHFLLINLNSSMGLVAIVLDYSHLKHQRFIGSYKENSRCT